jgi:hypothetical protein
VVVLIVKSEMSFSGLARIGWTILTGYIVSPKVKRTGSIGTMRRFKGMERMLTIWVIGMEENRAR